jgi:hypothetical protein
VWMGGNKLLLIPFSVANTPSAPKMPQETNLLKASHCEYSNPAK